MRSSKIEYREYMKSDEWKTRRVEALNRASEWIHGLQVPQCEFCGYPGERFKKSKSKLDYGERKFRVDGSNGLEVHHLHYRTLGTERPEDLVVLCTDNLHLREGIGCHERCHGDPSFRAAVERLVERRERK